MDPAPALPFEVVETDDGRMYRLPPRKLGAGRWLGFPLLVGVVIGFMLIVQFYTTQAAKGPVGEWVWVVLASLCLVWTRVSYTLVSFAAVVLCGRTEIVVTHDGAVRASDSTGWFRMKWGKLLPGPVRKFIVKPFLPQQDARRRPLPVFLWNLIAEPELGRKALLAPAHTREIVESLAQLLAKQLAVAAPEVDPVASAVPHPVAPPSQIPVVVEEPEIPTRDVLEQPPGSRVVVERHPDGVTITVPRLGLGKANGTFIFLGLLFVVIGGSILVSSLVSLFQANPKRPSGVLIPGIGFFFIGGFFFLSSLHTGLKKVVLAVVGDRLLTFETGPLGSRRREFARADLRDIRCGPSNISVNKKPLPQLQIVTDDKTNFGTLTSRDEIELKWIATVLRQALGLPSEPPEYRTSAPEQP